MYLYVSCSCVFLFKSIYKNRKCVIDVFKCQNGLAPGIFYEYFKVIQYQKDTRGNSTSLLLPTVRTEAGRKSFLFQ